MCIFRNYRRDLKHSAPSPPVTIAKLAKMDMILEIEESVLSKSIVRKIVYGRR
jgi:hypothetical protein